MPTVVTNSPSAQFSGDRSQCEYQGLVVIIPTRNRSDLAMRAVRTTLDVPVQDQVQILVSDNSTEESEISALQAFCQGLGDDRVRYLRPPTPMRMADHWEWAFEQGAQWLCGQSSYGAPGSKDFPSWRPPRALRSQPAHPDSVIVSQWDAVLDHIHPIVVTAKPWSGRLSELRSEALLAANARAASAVEQVPSPMIAIHPRRVFHQIRERFGDYCLSIAPDFCFGYRVLDVEESVLFYDKPMTFGST